jgi:hypothetical protein
MRGFQRPTKLKPSIVVTTVPLADVIFAKLTYKKQRPISCNFLNARPRQTALDKHRDKERIVKILYHHRYLLHDAIMSVTVADTSSRVSGISLRHRHTNHGQCPDFITSHITVVNSMLCYWTCLNLCIV